MLPHNCTNDKETIKRFTGLEALMSKETKRTSRWFAKASDKPTFLEGWIAASATTQSIAKAFDAPTQGKGSRDSFHRKEEALRTPETSGSHGSLGYILYKVLKLAFNTAYWSLMRKFLGTMDAAIADSCLQE